MWVYHSIMAETGDRRRLEARAADIVDSILRAATSWAREVPPALTPSIRAVCIRLAEMVADQRHYMAPLPEPQQAERHTVLALVAEGLRADTVSADITEELRDLAELELRATGSWSLVGSAQAEWITTAIQFLETAADSLPEGERPDPWWADDVVAGIIASVRAIVGIDELHARTESEFPTHGRPIAPDDPLLT